jgi:hypothetical protein
MGLSPVQYLNGSPWNGQARLYCIPASGDSNAYAIGDPVVLAGSADARGVPTVVLATAGSTNLITGAIVSMGGPINGGVMGDPTNLNTTIIPATKLHDYYVMVADDPNIIFEVQEIGTGTPFTATEIGLNCSLVAGTNNGFVSGWMLDNTTEAATAALQMKILGLAQRSDNAFGQYAKYLCLINDHSYKAPVAGA